jgi:hypothetical protein
MRPLSSSSSFSLPSSLYTYVDANLQVSSGNAITNRILDYLDCVRCDQYKAAFLGTGLLDEAKLRDLCIDGLDAFLSDTIGITDKNHRDLVSSMLGNLNSKSCLHLCVEKWDDQYICNQCYKYFNYDDGKAACDGHYDNLRDTAREAREREIEDNVTNAILDLVPPDLSVDQRKEYVGKMSQGRGVSIGWLVDFTHKNDCWDMTTQDVCKKFVFPATRFLRCRYVELDHMQGITPQLWMMEIHH